MNRKILAFIVTLCCLTGFGHKAFAADLPTVGGDKNTWGTKLNTFLSVAHETSGANGGRVKHVASGSLIDEFLAIAHEPSGANEGKVRSADTIYIPSPGTVQSTVQTRLRKIVYISDFVGNDLNTAITAIGATKTTLYFDVVSTCTGPLTIPDNICIVIPIESPIDIVSGTLTINASSSIGMYAAFTGSGNVVFGSGAVIEVYPDWFPGNDYGAQMNAAIASVKAIGGVKVKITKSAEVTTAINLTNVTTGLIIEGNGCSFTGAVGNPVLKAKLTTMLFDCTGANNLVFRDFGIDTDATTYPKCAFFLARNAAESGAGEHKFDNVRINAIAKFSIATIYSYGSEVNTYNHCVFWNNVAGAKTFYTTAFNTIHPITSVYVSPMATGGQSNSVTNLFGCSLYNVGGTNTDLFYFDGAEDFRIWGGFWYCTTGAVRGRAYIYVDTTNSTSNIVLIDGVRGEPGATTEDAPNYGLFFDNAVVREHSNWSIRNCRFDAQTNIVYVSDNSTLYGFDYSLTTDTSGCGISVKNLKFAHINAFVGKFEGRAGGTLLSCEFCGNIRTSFTLLGLSTSCKFTDYATNATWMTAGPSVSVYEGPIGVATLTVSSTTSVINNPVVTAASAIWLFPTSATAAAAVGSAVGVYVSSKVANTSFTITHPDTAEADKTFNYLIFN